MIELLALDLDGTLAIRGDEVSPGTRDALHAASEAGVEVAIATGRRYRTTLRAVENLGLAAPVVCLGGALVKEADGELVERGVLSPGDFSLLAGFYREAGLSPIGQRDGHGDGGPDFVIDGTLPWNGATSRYAEANREFCEWRKDLASEARDDVIELCGFGSEEELRRLALRVERDAPGRFETQLMPLPQQHPSRGGFFIEVRPAGMCKWTGLQALMAKRGLSADALCAVGDERNDLTMVAAAGMGVAMGNAHEELAQIADWVTARHDEDGIVRVVERILALR